MTDKRIFFTRHAQAEHNVAEDYSILDAPLTKLGREQSANLCKETQDGFQRDADLLVSSPLRRPMQTFIIGYAPLRERLEKEGKPVVILPELQECNDLPCDTGSDRATLEADPEFAGLDLSSLDPSPVPAHWGSFPSTVSPGKEWTSKQGLFSVDNVLERAKWVRRWIRSRPEKRIVVVAHGDILRAITDGYRSATPWANAEVREYTFRSADDDDAVVVPVKEVAKEGEQEPTSTDLAQGRA
ncbi:histidine phosphatase family protein [Rhodotorula paludigena]|uniref:histidine phosphatase family protein n=1 Tax=Rhodotorula paludigena TaxID=86838 RepID=UPI003173252C